MALARIAVLEAQARELLAQLQHHSSNSSTPSSADPPDAPRPVAKRPTGRRPGGQTGHRGHHRVRWPADRVDEVVTYVPSIRASCQTPVTEPQAYSRTCPWCGLPNHATILAEVRAHAFGPPLAANMSYLSGRSHLGKRPVKELVEAVYQVPVSLGSVVGLERHTAAALIVPHDQARDAIRGAPVGNADQTGWKQAGSRRWPWTTATVTVAYFVIHVHRGARGLEELLGRGDHRGRDRRPLVGVTTDCRRNGVRLVGPTGSAISGRAWEGVEPANNHAERVLRMGVLWRKNAFGWHGESGCRFVERILTVVQAVRWQKRSVLEFLEESVVAHRSGAPAPALVIPQCD